MMYPRLKLARNLLRGVEEMQQLAQRLRRDIQYFGQNLSSHIRDGAIVTKGLVMRAGFFQAVPLG